MTIPSLLRGSAAIVISLLLPTLAFAQAAATGTIEGRVFNPANR